MDRTNTGEIFVNDETQTPITTATATFVVADDTVITMTKTVDRENEYYFSGDAITFTIRITNNGTFEATGLFFSDIIDPSIEPITGTEFTVTTTGGTVTSRTSPITVSEINIPAGETVVVTITGRIA